MYVYEYSVFYLLNFAPPLGGAQWPADVQQWPAWTAILLSLSWRRPDSCHSREWPPGRFLPRSACQGCWRAPLEGNPHVPRAVKKNRLDLGYSVYRLSRQWFIKADLQRGGWSWEERPRQLLLKPPGLHTSACLAGNEPVRESRPANRRRSCASGDQW